MSYRHKYISEDKQRVWFMVEEMATIITIDDLGLSEG